MTHIFKQNEMYFVLDVESGAVHMVDELAANAINAVEKFGKNARDMLAVAFDYSDEEIGEILAEIEELRARGELFTPEQPEVLAGESGEIKAMCLHVAHDCNLRCSYCFAETGEYHGGRALMSPEVGKAALDFLVAHSGKRKHLEVDFFGGEPLMNFGVVKELVAYGRRLEQEHNKLFRFTLTTNGVAVDDEFIEFANKELYNVVISIDGRKEVHDKLRVTPNGKGSFDLIFPKVKKLAFARQERGLDYYVRGTFTRNNLDFSKDVEFLANEGFEQISLEPVVLEPGDPLSIRVEDLTQVFKEYDRLVGMLYSRRKTGQWFNFFHFMLDLENGPCLAKRMTGCGAGSEYCAVSPQGDIYPCHQFVGKPEWKMGSVLTGEYNRAMQKRFRECTVASKPACRECWAKYYCSGGCAANAQNLNGDIHKPYELACAMEKKRLECAIALYALERQDREEEAAAASGPAHS